jgi:hypothetical protein
MAEKQILIVVVPNHHRAKYPQTIYGKDVSPCRSSSAPAADFSGLFALCQQSG